MNYKKPVFWVILVSVVVCAAVAVCFLTNPKSKGSNVGTREAMRAKMWIDYLGMYSSKSSFRNIRA